jgi:hypothetical protein
LKLIIAILNSFDLDFIHESEVRALYQKTVQKRYFYHIKNRFFIYEYKQVSFITYGCLGGITNKVGFYFLKQKLEFQIKSLKYGTLRVVLLLRFARNKWIATSVASLLPRNDEKSYYHKQNHTFIFNIFFFVSQSLKPLRPSFLNKQERGKELAALVVPSYR